MPDYDPRAHRASKLTTTELDNLDVACQPISAAFDTPPYLVGTAGAFAEGSGYRDVDVRLILGDDDFAAICPTRERWELLSLAISTYLRERTGLPVDFQIQRRTEANDRFSGPRNPLGLTRRGKRLRVFAGGGDATPDWNDCCLTTTRKTARSRENQPARKVGGSQKESAT